MLTLNDGRSELWQWDTGRTLAVDADCSQVHFSNKVFGRSIDVDVVDGVATIPDILLQTDKDLNVWAFVGTAENGYTKISKTFKVNRRNKPADYVFTPTDQTTLAELSGRLDRIEESQDPGAIKNAVEDYLAQNPVESPVQSVNGQTGTVELTAEDVGAISQSDLQTATNEALAQAKASGEFDGADGAPGKDGADGYSPQANVVQNDGGVAITITDKSGTTTATVKNGKDGAGGSPGADGKSAYQYAQEGGYTGTETEFAAKLAEEMPDKLPNPNALTFTGAVTGSYDGSAPLSVAIPSGGGGISLPLLYDLTTSEEVGWIDTGDNAFLAKNFLFLELISIATATNESDGPGSASMYPLQSGAMQYPWANQVVARQISALMPKTYTKVFRAFCFRGDGGHWTSITSIRNDVNSGSASQSAFSMRLEGASDQPMRGLIIGKAFTSKTNVFGVGSRLRIWGV